MKNNRGFSLFEFFMTVVVLAVVIGVGTPIIMYAIKLFRINAFKNSAYNALDAVKYYVATTNFNAIPEEGIEISKLDIELKNNNFDGGIVKKIDNEHLKIINLSKNGYCATGTTDKMRATDKGCGALDETAPNKVFVYLKNSTKNSLDIVVGVDEKESEIVSYEYSIDGGKWTKKQASNEYLFEKLKSGEHKIKVKATNEAKLSTISEEVVFITKDIPNIECIEKDNLELYQSHKNIVCSYPTNVGYTYQYSIDNINWNNISLNGNTYEFKFSENSNMYTRVLENGKIISYASINISNIDNVLNGAYPELLDNMIPVVYDEVKNSWVKADGKKLYFDYKNKIWANAVLVRRNRDTDDPNSKSREYYLSDAAINQPINESDIIAYYVWIPRYKYVLFNTNGKFIEPKTIDIVFENKDTEKSISSSTGSYLTHPAFSYDEETNGFWVSKFQSNVSITSSCYSDSNNCNSDSIILYSLPDDHKITNISISNAHLSTIKMPDSNNIYGLDINIKSHVLTNLEWGAIAYLGNSIYGIDGNITNNGQYYKNNLFNSTTGNITGVFDMTGKNVEMVMGNYNKDAGKDQNDNSGFKNFGTVEFPSIIDYYSGITSKARILGDATEETEGWYNAYSKFVNGGNPFFIRGGVMDGRSSIYNYSSFTGNKNNDISFRTVLMK